MNTHKGLLPHLRAHHCESSQICEDLHGDFTVRYPAIDLQLFKICPGIELHALHDRVSLEGGGLQCRPSYVYRCRIFGETDINIPAAAGSHYGASNPESAVTK